MKKLIILMLLISNLGYCQFPNPTQSITKINKKYRYLATYDASGQFQKVNYKINLFFYEIDLSTLPSGIYFIKTDKKTFKIIKL